MVDGQAGKGDTYRPVNRAKYEAGYKMAFRGKPDIPMICMECLGRFESRGAGPCVLCGSGSVKILKNRED